MTQSGLPNGKMEGESDSSPYNYPRMTNHDSFMHLCHIHINPPALVKWHAARLGIESVFIKKSQKVVGVAPRWANDAKVIELRSYMPKVVYFKARKH